MYFQILNKFFKPLTVTLVLLSPALPANAQANKDYDACRAAGNNFGTCMTYMMERNGAGCTAARKQIRRQTKSAAKEGYYLAFAGRKDTTITGIRGCGYAWDTDKAKAQSRAMSECKKWEKTYGTGQGEKICALMN